MSIRVRDLLMRELNQLRYEPVEKRIRATLGGLAVVDSTPAMLVWEPKRVVPSYAVPAEDIEALEDWPSSTSETSWSTARGWSVQ